MRVCEGSRAIFCVPQEFRYGISEVSMRYVLSELFTTLARQRCLKDDPTFNDMKTAFWLDSDPIGHDVPGLPSQRVHVYTPI